MKTSYLDKRWLAPLVGIIAVTGIAVAATTCFKAQKNAESDEAFALTFERLSMDQHLSMALRDIHEGKVEAAAAHLDQLLCGHVILSNSELRSADSQTRNLTEQAFEEIARRRPMAGQRSSSGSVWKGGPDQVAAEKILKYALACAPSDHLRK